MKFLLSFLTGILTAAFGGIGAGCVAALCVRWYRISGFEGGSGYFVFFMALLGLVAGLVVGIIAAAIVFASSPPDFLRSLGAAIASMSALLLIAAGIAWLLADIAPTMDGRPLELAIEVRCPQGFPPLKTLPGYPSGAFATLSSSGGSPRQSEHLRLAEAKEVGGQWIVPATVPLDTSASTKDLRATFNDENRVTFRLPLRSHPKKSDFEWSHWIESTRSAGNSEPPPEGKFLLRYRVRIVQPPPPGPTQEEIAAKQVAEAQAAFEALPPDGPIEQWFPFTAYGAPEERLQIAIRHILARPNFAQEWSALMVVEDPQAAAQALRLLTHIPQPPPALLAPVAAAGRDITERLQKVNAITAAEDPGHAAADKVSMRFGAWIDAVRTLREKCGGDFTPELGAILQLSRARLDNYAIREDICRVASFYMQQWAGIAPLPTDPKPK